MGSLPMHAWHPRLLSAIALLAFLAGGCAPPDRVLVSVIGIDGADWRVIDPLLASGELPTFARLIEAGARAPLRSELPLNSAAIWTTVATGVSRSVHGIEEFRKHGRLISSADRNAPALWTLASDAGLRSAVLAWWASFPAEPIEGVVISERAFKSREGGGGPYVERRLGRPLRTRLTHPPQVLRALGPLLAALGDEPPRLPERDRVAQAMRTEDAVIARCTLQLRAEFGPFDLELLLLRGVDPVSHFFWRFHEPHADAYTPEERPAAEEVAKYGEQIRDHYRHVDGLLAELLADIGPERVVLLISDHGFEAGRQRFRTGAVLSGTHATEKALHGIFVAHGGPVRQGVRLEEVSIYDLAPSVLHLLDLPVADELPGHVLDGLFEAAWNDAHPVRRVERYEFEPAAKALIDPTSPADVRLEQELRALGYIE